MKNLLGVFIILVSACSSMKTAHKDTESWRHEIPYGDTTPLKPQFPVVLERKLSNGLTVLVVRDAKLPIAEIALAFKNGSALDPHQKAGLQNLTAMMLKEGTSKLTSLELAEKFADLGTEVRVGAGKDMSYINASILSDKFTDAMALIASMAQNPRFEQEDFKRVKSQQENEIRSEMGSPSYAAQVRFLKAAYGEKHPYANPSAGTMTSVANITVNDIKHAHKTNFGPNNAALVVVGDVTINQVMKAAEKYFGHWKKIKDPVRAIPKPSQHNTMQTILVGRTSMPQTLLLVGQPAATQHDKDLASYQVFQNILAGMPTSRLGASLREKKGWTYGVHSSLVPLRGQGPLLVSTSIQVPHGAAALQEILDEFENMKKNPVSKEELADAKSGLLNSFASRFTTLKKIASNIWENFIYDLPKDQDEKYYNEIAQVNEKDIMNIAKKSLPKDHMTAVAVGDLEVMQIPLAKMSVGKIIVQQD